MARRRRDKSQERALAEERVGVLVGLADEAAHADRWDLANRYADLARRLARRHQLGTPDAMRGRVCRKCGAFLVPGATSRVRFRHGKVVSTCLACGEVRRRPLAGGTVG